MHDQANVGLGLGLPSDLLCTRVNRPLTGLGIFIDPSAFVYDEESEEWLIDDLMSPSPEIPAQPSPILAPAPTAYAVQGSGEMVGLGIFVDCQLLIGPDEEL